MSGCRIAILAMSQTHDIRGAFPPHYSGATACQPASPATGFTKDLQWGPGENLISAGLQDAVRFPLRDVPG